ncbi:NAD-dependent epimerase/dehydratase family protein [Actinidia rufa]|uniref:NAD-dependent epimerase/dehydratase family protein n=1 Tax=Actinidia rufa TaxID=165716 RepID=A0A7J0DX59_9ERIC|nr:NAD-dependent epimerase/dehydratase family protein [Actinidia rufa]
MSTPMAPYQPKNILITGAAGFIASHVANRLIKNYPNYKIVALDKLDYCSSLENLGPSFSTPNFKFVKADIASADLVNYLLVAEEIDTIMHFAAQTHVDNSFGNSFEFTNNNIYGTHVLLEACKITNRVRRFIHVSTDEVYGETDLETDIGNPEASQLLPTNPYSATKAGAEMLVMAYHRPFNDKRYFLDDQKLKRLGWEERTSWEEGLKRTLDWYTHNPDWWGDVTAALYPHPRASLVVCWGNFAVKVGLNLSMGGQDWENRSSIVEDVRKVRPSHVFNAAGVTGKPNVDRCETHKVETIRTNVVGTLTLADVCKEQGLIMVNFATGCIFEYDEKHPQASFYSKTKAMVEELMREYENVCTLRFQMPISSDLSQPRNFITKMARYDKVLNVPNSMTVLDELLPISIEMAKRNLTGTWNFTNPGVISHHEILEMYREYMDPEFKWVNFDLEEQAKVMVAPRSHHEMNSSKLKNEFPNLLGIRESIIKYVFEPNKKT